MCGGNEDYTGISFKPRATHPQAQQGMVKDLDTVAQQDLHDTLLNLSCLKWNYFLGVCGA